VLQELAHSYKGPGITFPPTEDPPPGYLIRIHVERIGGLGPWASGLAGS
jgi:hypothetical protein